MINPILLLVIVAVFLAVVPTSAKRKNNAVEKRASPDETPAKAVATGNLAVPAIASALAAIQNMIMFHAGFNGGEYYAPVFYVGVFTVEVMLIWAGYFCVRKLFPKIAGKILIPMMAVVLLVGQDLMPQSEFWVDARRGTQNLDLKQIRLAVTQFKPPSPEQANTSHFELDYTLQFPRAGHYDVGGMRLDPLDPHLVIEQRADDPQYFAKDYQFASGKTYAFRTVFHVDAPDYDLSGKKVSVTVCEGEGYDLMCDNLPADAGEAIKTAEAAIEAAKPHHKPQDITALQARTEQGDTEAMYELARYYYDGEEIPQDAAKAIHWFRELDAAYQIFWNGDAAKIRATSFPQFGDKEVNAWANDSHELHESASFDFPRYKDDAEKGDAPGQVYLGRAYTIAAGTKQDFSEAYFWLSLAAKNPTLYNTVHFSETIAPEADAAGKHLSPEAMEAVKKRLAEWKPKPK